MTSSVSKLLWALLFIVPALPSPANPLMPSPQFVFVKIPENIMPIARGERYEDPIDAFLKSKKIGEVTGGGTMQSKPDKDGNRKIEYVGIDIDLSDLEKGLPLLKAELIHLGVPTGTTLIYTQNGVKKSELVK